MQRRRWVFFLASMVITDVSVRGFLVFPVCAWVSSDIPKTCRNSLAGHLTLSVGGCLCLRSPCDGLLNFSTCPPRWLMTAAASPTSQLTPPPPHTPISNKSHFKFIGLTPLPSKYTEFKEIKKSAVVTSSLEPWKCPSVCCVCCLLFVCHVSVSHQ